MFSVIKNTLNTIYTQFTTKVHSLFSRAIIDEQTLKELEKLLIQADTGVTTTRTIWQALEAAFKQGTIKKGEDLKLALHKELLKTLKPAKAKNAQVYLLVGINGSGKTTLAGKLAHKFLQENKTVLLAAGDTFRAAATEQLQQWANTLNTEMIAGKQDQDPGSVIFQACDQFKKQKENERA